MWQSSAAANVDAASSRVIKTRDHAAARFHLDGVGEGTVSIVKRAVLNDSAMTADHIDARSFSTKMLGVFLAKAF